MKQLDSTFKSIDTDDSLAMACINDDQPDTAGQAVRERYVQWMEGRWGGRGVWDEWEKEGAAW